MNVSAKYGEGCTARAYKVNDVRLYIQCDWYTVDKTTSNVSILDVVRWNSVTWKYSPICQRSAPTVIVLNNASSGSAQSYRSLMWPEWASSETGPLLHVNCEGLPLKSWSEDSGWNECTAKKHQYLRRYTVLPNNTNNARRTAVVHNFYNRMICAVVGYREEARWIDVNRKAGFRALYH